MGQVQVQGADRADPVASGPSCPRVSQLLRRGRRECSCISAPFHGQSIGLISSQVIVDSAKPYLANQPSIREATPQLLVFSAHQNDSLKDRAAKILEYAEKHSDHLPDIAYTLGARRDALQHRAFAVVDGTSSAEMSPVIRPREAPAVNFIFTGQGAQWGGMGADLLTQYPSFQKDIRSMDAALQKLAHPPSWTIEGEQKDVERCEKS